MGNNSNSNINWSPNDIDALKQAQVPGKKRQSKIDEIAKKPSGSLLDIAGEISNIQDNINDGGS